LALAALSTSLGFLSFLPTEYAGISELGIIAGGGMVIALVITLTMLPALITVLRPPGEPEPIGFARAASVDAFLLRRRKHVAASAGLAALVCAALLPFLRFDFNPLNLKDPHTESAATMFELIADPNTSPFTADVLTPSLADAQALAARMKALPQVERTLTLASFVPDDQDKKLPIIEDLNMLLGPTLSLPPAGAPPTEAEIRATMTDCADRLERLAGGGTDATRRLATGLRALLAQNPLPIDALNKALLSGLDRRVGMLREALQAGPVTLETLPDDLRRNWIAKDGRARLEITPRGDVRDNDVIRRFAKATLAVSSEVTGSPITILESGNTVVQAFKIAGLAALATITLLLAVVLRRVRDTLLVLAPLVLAGLLTAGTMVAFGMPLNFANIIALPLLLGIGVAFDIYFVTNWRVGRGNPLQSSLARAILYSGLTTGMAFGSLALSAHPGTSSMGVLLALMLAYALFCTLFVLPALLGPPPKEEPAPRKSALD
jgi:hopanoid biosynthesis associated RND transporter like protein HpnN